MRQNTDGLNCGPGRSSMHSKASLQYLQPEVKTVGQVQVGIILGDMCKEAQDKPKTSVSVLLRCSEATPTHQAASVRTARQV